MFQAPTRASSFVAPPPGAINTDQRYLFKLVKLEDRGISPYADPAKNETQHSIDWHFQVANFDTMQPIFDPDGKPWVYVEQATSKTGKNPKSGQVAKSRLFIEALLGHSISDDEITADLPNQLLNKYASGFFEYVDRQAQDGTNYKKLQIMRLSPYQHVGGQQPAPRPAPPPPPPPQPAADTSLPF